MRYFKVSGFQWDEDNRDKCQKHGVLLEIIEDLFMRPIVILPDENHSNKEQRFKAIGKTKEARSVFVVFTLRKIAEEFFIRPISARYMHHKEVSAYETENPNL
jgi:uncharacterized DUF497 family protein